MAGIVHELIHIGLHSFKSALSDPIHQSTNCNHSDSLQLQAVMIQTDEYETQGRHAYRMLQKHRFKSVNMSPLNH